MARDIGADRRLIYNPNTTKITNKWYETTWGTDLLSGATSETNAISIDVSSSGGIVVEKVVIGGSTQTTTFKLKVDGNVKAVWIIPANEPPQEYTVYVPAENGSTVTLSYIQPAAAEVSAYMVGKVFME